MENSITIYLTDGEEDYSLETQLKKVPTELQSSATILFNKISKFLKCPIEILDVVNDNVDISGFGLDENKIKFVFEAKTFDMDINDVIEAYDKFCEKFWDASSRLPQYECFTTTYES